MPGTRFFTADSLQVLEPLSCVLKRFPVTRGPGVQPGRTDAGVLAGEGWIAVDSQTIEEI